MFAVNICSSCFSCSCSDSLSNTTVNHEVCALQYLHSEPCACTARGWEWEQQEAMHFFYCMRWIIEGGLRPNRHNRRQWLIPTQFLDLTSRGSRRGAFRYPADVEDQRLCVISQYQGVLCLPRGAESQIDMLDEHVRECQRVLQLSEIG